MFLSCPSIIKCRMVKHKYILQNPCIYLQEKDKHLLVTLFIYVSITIWKKLQCSKKEFTKTVLYRLTFSLVSFTFNLLIFVTSPFLNFDWQLFIFTPFLPFYPGSSFSFILFYFFFKIGMCEPSSYSYHPPPDDPITL